MKAVSFDLKQQCFYLEQFNKVIKSLETENLRLHTELAHVKNDNFHLRQVIQLKDFLRHEKKGQKVTCFFS